MKSSTIDLAAKSIGHSVGWEEEKRVHISRCTGSSDRDRFGAAGAPSSSFCTV